MYAHRMNSVNASWLIYGLVDEQSLDHYLEMQLLNHQWVIGDLAKEEQMDPEIVSRLQSFNARRKLRAAAIASVWSSTIFLRTKKLKSLLGSHDLSQEELENLRVNFKRM